MGGKQPPHWQPDPRVLAFIDQTAARDGVDLSGPAGRALAAAAASLPPGPLELPPPLAWCDPNRVAVLYERAFSVLAREADALTDRIRDLETRHKEEQ